MNIIPMVFDTAGNKEYTYDLFSLLLKNRIIFLTGEVNDLTAANIIGQILYLNNLNNEDIFLYINSPGGSVTAGLGIYDTINFVESNIITIGIGICASMGAFLLSSGNKRYALPNCEIMIHEPLGGATGQASDIKIHSDHILKIQNKINKILSKNTGKSITKIENDTKKDFFMSAKEAKEYGIIDEIIKKESNRFL